MLADLPGIATSILYDQLYGVDRIYYLSTKSRKWRVIEDRTVRWRQDTPLTTSEVYNLIKQRESTYPND